MVRWLIRVLLVIYLALPVISIMLIFTTVQQIQADVEPVLEQASNRISEAAASLQVEISAIGTNFEPLVNTINALRSGLDTVATFVSGAVNAMVDAVNGLTFNTLRIPRFTGIRVPALVDLTFLNRIGDQVTIIADEVNEVSTSVTSTVGSRIQLLLLALVVLVVWIVMGFALMWLTMFLTLGRG